MPDQILRMIPSSPRCRNNTIDKNNTHDENDQRAMRPTPQSPQDQASTTNSHDEPTHNHNDPDTTSDSDSDAHDVDSDNTDVPLNTPVDDNNDDEEPWPDFIRRCTREAERQMTNIGIDDWVTQQRRRK